MSFRAFRQMLVAAWVCAISFAGLGQQVEQPHSFDADAVTGRQCLRYVHSDVLTDERTEAVREFLEKHHCDIGDLAAEFVLAADLNDLDYRLLPTLSVIETGCGRATRNNNLFGWANGRKHFATMRQSIHHVAQRLRLAPHYSGKTLTQKLRVYNRRTWWRKRVFAMMAQMPTDPPVESSASE